MRALVFLAFLAACDTSVSHAPATAASTPAAEASPAAEGSRSDVDVATLAKALEGGVAVIDVRTPGEYAGGHVPGAVNVPLSELSTSVPAIAEHAKDEPLYVICAVGGRSSVAADRLAEAGYTTVNVEGGTAAWQRAGLPVE